MKTHRTATLVAAGILALLAACQTTTQAAPAPTNTTSTPTPGACHAGTDSGQPLPDPHCTPGALNPAVTQQDIGATICNPGWASRIRPPESYTEPIKRTSIRQYGFTDTHLADYELDHRVPLSSGGDPRSRMNLWPQGYEHTSTSPAKYGSESKDRIEDYVHRSICSGKLSLAAGQSVFLGNWWTWRTNNMPRSVW